MEDGWDFSELDDRRPAEWGHVARNLTGTQWSAYVFDDQGEMLGVLELAVSFVALQAGAGQITLRQSIVSRIVSARPHRIARHGQ